MEGKRPQSYERIWSQLFVSYVFAIWFNSDRKHSWMSTKRRQLYLCNYTGKQLASQRKSYSVYSFVADG